MLKYSVNIFGGHMNTDILIAGCGCAGLYCALKLPTEKKITVITKSDAESSDSFLAQGGICVQRDDEDFESFFEDTLRAGHYENDRESVKIMIRSSRDIIKDLVSFGAEFNKAPDGSFDYTKEGAHSRKRILFHKDVTGKEITSKLLCEARKRPNIEILEHTTLVDIIDNGKEAVGAVISTDNGVLEAVKADFVVLATGGIGGLFKHSTNFRHLTGDALAIAMRHGVELENIDYIQIHPTTFYSKNESDRSFLISESVRGEGAKLYNKDMERFVDELLPRDKVTEAINKQMELDGSEHVWEDMRPIPKDELLSHFPNIVEHCRSHGYDPVNECIPIVPAQHYFMGGVKVNYESRTSMPRLYAIGETACNRVHGKNRLASNSLLESLVFAGRAAADMASTEIKDLVELPNIDMSKYASLEKWNSENKEMILNEIKRSQKNV
jgi:L-aspartate oxidase